MSNKPEFAQVGTWCITTPGALIGYIADEQDAAIAFVVKDKEQFDDGTFIQLMVIIQVPDGHVQEMIDHMRCLPDEYSNIMISKTLTKLMEAGLVK